MPILLIKIETKFNPNKPKLMDSYTENRGIGQSTVVEFSVYHVFIFLETVRIIRNKKIEP